MDATKQLQATVEHILRNPRAWSELSRPAALAWLTAVMDSEPLQRVSQLLADGAPVSDSSENDFVTAALLFAAGDRQDVSLGMSALDNPVFDQRLHVVVIDVAEALAELDQARIRTCASLGILDRQDFEVLKKAGVTRYHHNLETAESNFERMCTTHTYRERVDAILAAKEAGLSVCAGGVFGIGETDEQVLELALALRDLDVDAVPVNFLVPIKGTPAESYSRLTPLRCLKIISLLRYVLPDKEIIICGGRENNLKDLHPLIFYAGASGIMTQDYLTTTGRALKEDLDMIDRLAFSTSVKRGKGL